MQLDALVEPAATGLEPGARSGVNAPDDRQIEVGGDQLQAPADDLEALGHVDRLLPVRRDEHELAGGQRQILEHGRGFPARTVLLEDLRDRIARHEDALWIDPLIEQVLA